MKLTNISSLHFHLHNDWQFPVNLSYVNVCPLLFRLYCSGPYLVSIMVCFHFLIDC